MHYIQYLRKEQLKHMDARVDILNELIGAMRLVKMYCWEKPFSERVNKVRDMEMNSLWSVPYFQLDAWWVELIITERSRPSKQKF